MTDKELNQIDFWLSGQKRYKLLDCSRRGFLKLKGARLQVWLAHYTSERDSQQSWLSLEWLMADTGCSKPTVIAARRWLVKHGWIRVLEGSAADMYENPTQGAHKVRIMCVDDPTNGVGGKESLLGEVLRLRLHMQLRACQSLLRRKTKNKNQNNSNNPPVPVQPRSGYLPMTHLCRRSLSLGVRSPVPRGA